MAKESMQHNRGDITNSLVHLTKGIDGSSSLDVLCQILNAETIIGSGKGGFIKGPNSATCFTETPLSALKHFASEEDKPKDARYRYYGVAVSKEAAFTHGARPVIYLPDNEASWIPEEEKWRHVRYEYGSVDWTHEREWRVQGDFDLTAVPGIYVICWHANEVRTIKKALGENMAKKVRGFLPMSHLNQML
jgi:hypothetical protein